MLITIQVCMSGTLRESDCTCTVTTTLLVSPGILQLHGAPMGLSHSGMCLRAQSLAAKWEAFAMHPEAHGADKLLQHAH